MLLPMLAVAVGCNGTGESELRPFSSDAVGDPDLRSGALRGVDRITAMTLLAGTRGATGSRTADAARGVVRLGESLRLRGRSALSQRLESLSKGKPGPWRVISLFSAADPKRPGTLETVRFRVDAKPMRRMASVPGYDFAAMDDMRAHTSTADFTPRRGFLDELAAGRRQIAQIGVVCGRGRNATLVASPGAACASRTWAFESENSPCGRVLVRPRGVRRAWWC